MRNQPAIETVAIPQNAETTVRFACEIQLPRSTRFRGAANAHRLYLRWLYVVSRTRGTGQIDASLMLPRLPEVNFTSARIRKGDARLDASTEARIPQARRLPTVINSTAGHFRAGLPKTAHLRDGTELLRATACVRVSKRPQAETAMRAPLLKRLEAT
jgi:hypothetical protein